AASAGAEEAAAEACALFVSPVDEPYRHRRPSAVALLDGPDDLEPCEYVEAAVEPPSARHRVHVPADEQFCVRLAPQCRPHVAGSVGMGFQSERVELLSEPRSRLQPRVRPRHPPRAVLVAGAGPQVLEFFNGPLLVECAHRPSLPPPAQRRCNERYRSCVTVPVTLV